MKRNVIQCVQLLVCLFLVGCYTSSARISKFNAEYDLYLLVGQSNMAGRGEMTTVDSISHPRVFALAQDDKWVPAKEPLHYDKENRGVGPGLTFGKTMADMDPNVKIGLIPAAVGGTKISYWEPGGERGLYEEALRKAKIAMESGRLKGIIWQQGESDSNEKDAPMYKERLIMLMKSFRKDLGKEDVPIVFGGLGDFLKSKNFHVVNEALNDAADELPNAAFSEASKLGHIGDRLHFNAEAQHENGVNMAKEMMTLIE